MKPSLYLLIPALFLVSCDQQEVAIQQDDVFDGLREDYYGDGTLKTRANYEAGKYGLFRLSIV